jgi:hypothetical protein
MKAFRTFGIVLCLLLSVQFSGAQSVALSFTTMPTSLIPEVSVETRKDLVDFIRNGKVAVMPSAFGGKVTLLVLTDDYLRLHTSDMGETQIKKISLNDTTSILIVVQTVGDSLKDSRMKVFDAGWKPVSGYALPKLVQDDFLDFPKAGQLGVKDLFHKIPSRLFVSWMFESGSNRLVAHSSLKQDLSLEFKDAVASVVRDSVEFRFVNGSFVRR